MNIANLRAYALREPVSRRSYTAVRVDTDSGLRGYGECASVSAPQLEQARRLLAGMPASAFEVVRQALAGLPGLQAAVNMALLDIVGRRAGAPVYQVLGGPTRQKARALAPLSGDSDSALAGSLARARNAGYRAFAVPLPPVHARNQGQAFVDATRRRLDVLRAAADGDSDFVLDGAGALTPGDAAGLCRALERFHLLWFDEPCPLANLAAIGKLSGESVTPLGFGRHAYAGGILQDLLREGALDVIRPSLHLNGITQIRKMAALAESYYVAVAPAHEGGPIGTAAALHTAASLPNFFIQEIPLPAADEDRRMREELTTRAVENVRDGFADLPAGPGLGIEVNEDALRRYEERA